MGEVEGRRDLVEVREGLARLLVPKGHTIKGPGRVGRGPFYNEAMAFSRHITVLVLEALRNRVRRFLDGLASTGVLGVRVALEVGGTTEIALNDRREDACTLIRRNLEINGIEGAKLSREDLNVLLCKERYDYVDVDPFGTPVPFLENALRSLAPRGFLGVTATDTAPLAGTFPRTCLRRYGATSVKAPFSHEVGLRILVGFIVRSAAKYDLAARPVLTLWGGHYYRAYLEVTRGARRADEALRQIGQVAYTTNGNRGIAAKGAVGPLWTGNLHDVELLKCMTSMTYMPATVSNYREVLMEEATAPALFYTTDEVASSLRISPPPLDKVLDNLKDAGFEAARTTLNPKGFRTTASWDEVQRILGSQ